MSDFAEVGSSAKRHVGDLDENERAAMEPKETGEVNKDMRKMKKRKRRAGA